MGVGLYFASHSSLRLLYRHGTDLGHDYFPALLIAPVVVAVAAFLALRRRIGRAAIWPALVTVLSSAACFPIYLTRHFGLG